MIFEIHPSQIERLEPVQLVELLRKLMYAEAQDAGISLRSVSAPLQITISDGGEDARVQWIGGLGNTDFFPHRFTIFQCKATDPGPAGWKKEVWTKSTQREGVARVLNDAVAEVIAGSGAYVGFTSSVIVGNKLTRRIQAIKTGIAEAGGDVQALSTVDIYDANRIAGWVGRHPAVATWLNEAQSGLPLGGFQTISGWGHRTEFLSVTWVDDATPRFLISDSGQATWNTAGAVNSAQARERILSFVTAPKKCVRVVGPSGIGKSRFVFEMLRSRDTLESNISSASTIFCDYRTVGQQRLHQIVAAVVNAAVHTLFVVDECPRESAEVLASLVAHVKSRCSLICIDNDDRPLAIDNVINVAVSRGGDDMVGSIIRQRAPAADETTIGYLKNLCGGFPRIAILATDSHIGGLPAFRSIDDVVERIVSGSGIRDGDQLRALECLSLFERVGVEHDVAEQLDVIAESLARQTGDEMFEHLAAASKYHLVDRRGRFFQAQPLPVASYLGARRIDLLRTGTILRFIDAAPEVLVLSFLRRWRYFDTTRNAISVSELLLRSDGKLGSREVLMSGFGAQCLDALSHVVPDAVADTLKRALGDFSPEDIEKNITDGRRHLVWLLERLAFRRQTFQTSARLLMYFSAAETENWANNSTGVFNQLFQLELSGTEADPSERFAILNEGIDSADLRIVRVCLNAISSCLGKTYFSRTVGAEEIGSQPPLRDWNPTSQDDIKDYFHRGLSALERIRSLQTSFSDECDTILANSLRTLIAQSLIDAVEPLVLRVAERKDVWFQGIQAIGQWLYFDRGESTTIYQRRIRTLYDKLLPTDPTSLAILYTSLWPADILDPDEEYDRTGTTSQSFDYSSGKAREVANIIARDATLVERAIAAMFSNDLKNADPFAHELALKVCDPVATFKLAIDAVDHGGQYLNTSFIRGMLRGIDERDSAMADKCVQLAVSSDRLKGRTIEILTAVKISSARVREITQNVRDGKLAPAHCIYLSYGQALAHLSSQDILPLLDELASNHGCEGVWAALEIVSMYRHGNSDWDRSLLDLTINLLGSPELFAEVKRANREGYLFTSLVQTLPEAVIQDDSFVSRFGEQIVHLCKTAGAEAALSLADPVRKVAEILMTQKPVVLWSVIARFVEGATPMEMHRLNRLVGKSRRLITLDAPPSEGFSPLLMVPEAIRFAWADADPATRSPFLATFSPLFVENGENIRSWHPALEALVRRYGTNASFRDALSDRLRIRSWSGSIVPYLEAYFAPLESWFAHPSHQIAEWARQFRRQLDIQIVRETRREEEGM